MALLLPVLHYNAGYRLDQVTMDNQDLLRPSFSFNRAATVSSPKGTLTFLPPKSASFLPLVSLSYGQAFHTNDPRIGTSAIRGGTIVAKARAYQLVASKTVAKTEFRLSLSHVTTAQQLGRISNDTGLQEDEGPGIVKSMTFTVRHNFHTVSCRVCSPRRTHAIGSPACLHQKLHGRFGTSSQPWTNCHFT